MSEAEPHIIDSAFKGACPRCGAPSLFAGWIKFAERCRGCGLDYAAFNVGDGPAAFLTLIVGTIITVLSIWVELAFSPPVWLHLLLWIPLTILLVVFSLRWAKGALLALEYRNAAREGRLKEPKP
ncbi:DUF983 domain-containing protein [Sphingomonas sp. MG17]|uniref:DUF983 domain-containing protein n=1 Tax=Sphingomonas tagetis TaxID=2949092 RepID=A0A9X2HTG3_9SPHN|nr:DUF983 domain-containing protein [Sphingomonas tagetis]MCP3732320.1 DUF983 domain-containing protein [Sphingomonas tagetis]